MPALYFEYQAANAVYHDITSVCFVIVENFLILFLLLWSILHELFLNQFNCDFVFQTNFKLHSLQRKKNWKLLFKKNIWQYIECIKVDSTLIYMYIVSLTIVTMVSNYLTMKLCVTIVFAKFRHFLVPGMFVWFL